MDTKKILSSDMLDILFDERNKEYGAYELRRTYHQRIRNAMIVTGSLTLLLIVSSAFAGKKRSGDGRVRITTVVELKDLKEPDKKIETPPPVKRPEPPQVQMRAFTAPIIKPNDEVEKPPPQVDQLDQSKIGDVDREGIKDMGFPDETKPDDGKGIIEDKSKEDEDKIWTSVQVKAHFPGGESGWIRYLEKNCNGQVAVDNGAPEGRYTVEVQFIVDKEGNISDVRALTSHGYGVEEEAIRVIKKGPKWNPAIQEGIPVKAYRKQPITFVVDAE